MILSSFCFLPEFRQGRPKYLHGGTARDAGIIRTLNRGRGGWKTRFIESGAPALVNTEGDLLIVT